MARMPDTDAARRAFAELPVSQRRAIARAVSRGIEVEQRKHAPIAVMLARRQQRMWRWIWLTGPLVGLVQLNAGWQIAVAGGLIGTLTLGLMSRWWWGRAKRAELRNIELFERKGKKSKRARSKGGGHTPTTKRRGGRSS